ncbi:MAG TPA: signal peptidase I, partial [Burkholderiales bacterium]|nr:signal peptidase I [Burkholderiales bacterium]
VPALFAGLALTLAVWLYGMIDAWRGAKRRQDYFARSWQKSGLYALVFLVCNALALPFLIGYVRAHEVESFRIPSRSMEPGILHGDTIFADKRYNCPGCREAVQRGDIAIFVYPNNRTRYYIKRIIGLPGDHVAITGHEVMVNGKPLTVKEEKSPKGMLVTESMDGKTWAAQWTETAKKPPEANETVPPGQVFVMGDNRDESVDSRIFGTVALQDVVGKARQIWFSKGSGTIRWTRFGKVLE